MFWWSKTAYGHKWHIVEGKYSLSVCGRCVTGIPPLDDVAPRKMCKECLSLMRVKGEHLQKLGVGILNELERLQHQR